MSHFLIKLFSVTFFFLFSDTYLPILADKTDLEYCSISKDDNGGSCKWSEFISLHNQATIKYKNIMKCDENSKNNESEKCSTCYDYVINNDLSPYESINYSDLEKARELVNHYVTYQIINHKLYRFPSDCLFPSRCEGIEYFLHQLKHKLADTEFVVNTHDWPYINKYFMKKKGLDTPPPPVFSFSKTNDYSDIFFPAWTFWAGGPSISLYPAGLGRWDLMREKLLKSKKDWDDKIDKAFFRGSRTSSERDNLVLLSRAFPDIVDASYTKNQGWKSSADTLNAQPAKEISLEDHCDYKYLFNFRGVAASFRYKHLFLCESLVFHVGDEWLEFFYDSMIPWFHYIPVASQASQNEIKHLVEFARENPAIAQAIAKNGLEFIKNHLKMSDISCYWNKLLNEYTKLLGFKPTLNNKSILLTSK